MSVPVVVSWITPPPAPLKAMRVPDPLITGPLEDIVGELVMAVVVMRRGVVQVDLGAPVGVGATDVGARLEGDAGAVGADGRQLAEPAGQAGDLGRGVGGGVVEVDLGVPVGAARHVTRVPSASIEGVRVRKPSRSLSWVFVAAATSYRKISPLASGLSPRSWFDLYAIRVPSPLIAGLVGPAPDAVGDLGDRRRRGGVPEEDLLAEVGVLAGDDVPVGWPGDPRAVVADRRAPVRVRQAGGVGDLHVGAGRGGLRRRPVGD